MKKILLSLAALMMMTAPVMTSCSSEDLDEVAPEVVTPETGTHVETLTIAFPDQAETRVAIDGSYNLTGWEEGDEVTLVQTWFDKGQDDIGTDKFEYTYACFPFRCTNAENGTFTGTLPDGIRLNECQFAFYNATNFETYTELSGGFNRFYFSPKKRASQDMKDVVMMVGRNDGNGHFEMKIFGSILKVTNLNRADVTASVKFRTSGYGYYSRNEIAYDQYSGYDDKTFGVDAGFNDKHTFILSKDAPTYVYIPVHNDPDFAVGLSAEEDATNVCSIVPFKTNPGNAKLFKAIVGGKGTAKATIGGREVDVKWVQLWKNGPKFAEYNVGVTDGKVGSYGGYYYWGSSIDKDPNGAYREGSGKLSGTDDTATNLWGNNWRMPTKDELDRLLSYYDGEWTTDDGVKGLKFTGTGDYESFSVFLPAAGFCISGEIDDHDLGLYGGYWSSTSSGSNYAAYLFFDTGSSDISWDTRRHSVEIDQRYFGCSVRAVLKE